MTARRIIVRGRVQGVGYRDWIRREARRLGLAGWVRNRSDGSVEILAEGDAQTLDALAGRCRVGPRTSVVHAVEVTATDEAPDGPEFVCKPSL